MSVTAAEEMEAVIDMTAITRKSLTTSAMQILPIDLSLLRNGFCNLFVLFMVSSRYQGPSRPTTGRWYRRGTGYYVASFNWPQAVCLPMKPRTVEPAFNFNIEILIT